MNGKPLTPKCRRSPVTIAIGFTNVAGVVLASDSQASDFIGTYMRPDETKVCPISLFNGGTALVAKAGTLETTDWFLENFGNKAASSVTNNARAIAELAEEAMRETRARLLTNFNHASLPEGASLEHLKDYSCKVLLGYMHEETPFLYTLSSDSCWAVKSARPFEALGCGAGIASYVLTGFDLPNLAPEDSLGLVAYAIQMCKNHDTGCGGRIQCGLIYEKNGSKCIMTNPIVADVFERGARKAELAMLKPLTEIIKENMRSEGLFKND